MIIAGLVIFVAAMLAGSILRRHGITLKTLDFWVVLFCIVAIEFAVYEIVAPLAQR